MERRILIAVAIAGLVLLALQFRGMRFAQQSGDALPGDLLPGGMLPGGTTADAILVEKSMHRMSLLRDGQVLRSYAVALGRGGPEPKTRQGDRRTPEGTYYIDRRNAHSCCYLALHISYPNAADIAAARAHGVSAGGDIEIHGLTRRTRWLGSWHSAADWTSGCIAVTDREMDEIWNAVPNGTPIVIRH
jgi:murein L,D-transpeptidase YafK